MTQREEPRLLQAKAEVCSLARTLEHLQAVEVTAIDDRRLVGRFQFRFRFANLPTRAALNDFDLDAASGI